MDKGYEKILTRLSKISEIEEGEINRRVEAKRSKLSGLISREGALQVIAAELGISFDNEKLKIDELLPGMRKVNFSGKIITMYPIRTFITKSGDEGKVANIVVADDTSNIKVVLWDTNHIALLENEKILEGSCIEIFSGNMRDGEVHMGSFSEIKLSEEDFPNVIVEKPLKKKEICQFKVGDNVNTRAFIVQSFDPRFYDAHPETGKKITGGDLTNGILSEKRAILNIIIDDGTENIRAVLFHEMIQKLGFTDYENPEYLTKQKENILGKEIFIGGNVKMNSYFNTPELIVNFVEEIDVDKLIMELE